MPLTSRLLRVGFPIALLLLCLALWFRISSRSGVLDAVPNAVGPGGWPRAMIVGLAIFSAMTLLAELFEWRSSIRRGGDAIVAGDAAAGGQSVALIGIGLILAYGFSIPYVGFAFATAAFIALWCLLGRVRSPLTIMLISVLGTVTLLCMFVALAKMPLNRGIEPFNSATVAIYRLLRIY
ncbi:MAG: tripartite tricarboxylate transporter TctB family protein [Hyphomicrobiaceae bacterium]|nr:tripartite tricarboxylate transporter TctB family protein [Hyphomicrobiaceae bacterium]